MDLQRVSSALEDFSVKFVSPLWIAHCIIMSVNLRLTCGPAARSFAKKHPLTTYAMAIVYTFPGGILAALFMGQPPFAFLANTPLVATASACWYLTFFSPGDFWFSVFKQPIVLLPLACLQDIMRLSLAQAGAKEIIDQFPKAYLYAIGKLSNSAKHFEIKIMTKLHNTCKWTVVLFQKLLSCKFYRHYPTKIEMIGRD